VSTDFLIDDWLAEEGIQGAAGLAVARTVLVAAGLTTGKKQRMARGKLDRARAALWDGLAGWCGADACEPAARATGRTVARTTRERCAGCRGSNSLQAARTAAEACQRAGIRRVVVLGGSPAPRQEAARLARQAGGPALVFVEGDVRVTLADARADTARADVVLAWAGTHLPHKTSGLYRPRAAGDPPFVTVPTTGVAALFSELAEHARNRLP
jgi:hypothetical protein